MTKKNVLILSIYYPPINSIASNRIYSFTKYLRKDKYNITVITVDNNDLYLNNLENVKIIRIKNNILFKPFSFLKKTNKLIHLAKVAYNMLFNKIFQDEYRNWKKQSIYRIEQLLKEQKIDIMLSTYSPITPHLVALDIKKKYHEIKWISDMRDEMGKNSFVSSKSREKLVKIEKMILNYCDALTTVSKPILEEFKNNTTRKIIFKEIRNGYDFKFPENKKNNIITFVYTGTLYGNRNPDNLFKVMVKLKNKIKFRLELIGVNKPIDIPIELKNNVIQIEKVSHEKALEYMINADVLLLLQPSVNKKGIFTGKIFEYIAMLKPILALIDTSDVAANLLRNTNLGFISDNNDLELIEKKILLIYDNWLTNKSVNPNLDIIRKHHRLEQCKRLEKLIEELIE